MAQDPKYETGKLYSLPLSLIDVDLDQPRRHFDQEATGTPMRPGGDRDAQATGTPMRPCESHSPVNSFRL